MNKKALFAAIKERYSSEDLDEHVQEIMNTKASEVNNNGMDAQLEFLAAESSLAWLEEVFIKNEDG